MTRFAAYCALPAINFDWLENAIHGGVVNYPFLFARDPFLSNLRRDRRFEPQMAQVKAVWVRMSTHIVADRLQADRCLREVVMPVLASRD